MAALGDDLLRIVNQLQDLVFNTIGTDSLDLPQIVCTTPFFFFFLSLSFCLCLRFILVRLLTLAYLLGCRRFAISRQVLGA